MHVVISGGTGLIGQALHASLLNDGHSVTLLVRRNPEGPDEASWDPASGWVDTTAFERADVVVNLSGAPVAGKRWTEQYRRTIMDSRVNASQVLANAMAGLDKKPSLYIQASGVGFYGDRDDEVLEEQATPGRAFLSDVCVEWEGAAAPAADAGIPCAFLRTGLVMSSQGGAFAKMLPLFKAGLGGPLGDGSAWWPWITLHDHIRAIRFVMDAPLGGPVNMVGPAPVRQSELAQALGKALRRPSLIPAPSLALRLAVGEFSTEILASTRAVPSFLLDAGFTFDHPTIDEACRWLANTGQ